ncbi:MAG: alpha/beta fold hydrolase [Bacteroidota bacterium]
MISALQEKLIFLPTKLDPDFQFQFQSAFEEINLMAKDGANLNALHFTQANSNKLILYFHGNAGDLSRWGLVAEELLPLGYNVLIMDYRSYGKSTGSLSEKALQQDAQLFYDWAINHYTPEEIVVYGRSLGGNIATYVASQNPVNQLILETPFFNLADVAQARFPFLPLKSLLRYKMRSDEFIQKVDVPITIFHGTADRVVAYESGKKLFDSIPHEKKTFYTIPDGGHNNLSAFPLYWKQLQKTLE